MYPGLLLLLKGMTIDPNSAGPIEYTYTRFSTNRDNITPLIESRLNKQDRARRWLQQVLSLLGIGTICV